MRFILCYQDILQSPEEQAALPPEGVSLPPLPTAEPETDLFGGGGEWLTWNQLMPEEDVIASCWTQLIDVEQDDGRVIFSCVCVCIYLCVQIHIYVALKGRILCSIYLSQVTNCYTMLKRIHYEKKKWWVNKSSDRKREATNVKFIV